MPMPTFMALLRPPLGTDSQSGARDQSEGKGCNDSNNAQMKDLMKTRKRRTITPLCFVSLLRRCSSSRGERARHPLNPPPSSSPSVFQHASLYRVPRHFILSFLFSRQVWCVGSYSSSLPPFENRTPFTFVFFALLWLFFAFSCPSYFFCLLSPASFPHFTPSHSAAIFFIVCFLFSR